MKWECEGSREPEQNFPVLLSTPSQTAALTSAQVLPIHRDTVHIPFVPICQ